MAEEIQNAASREGVSQSQIINQALTSYFQTQLKRSMWDSVGQDDSWYDRKKFYTGSEDKKGHGSQVRFHIPKNLAGQISRIVSSGLIPELRGNNDFYRDAFFHRAKEVAQWIDDGELEHEADLQMMIAEERLIAQQKLDVDELMEETRRNLEEAWAREDWPWLETYLQQRKDKVGVIPESFRGRYTRMLKDFEKKLRGREEKQA